MLKYKNVTETVLRFRAHDVKGVKQVFVLQPGEEMESDREVSFGGLEQIKDIKHTKTKKESDK